MPVFQKIEPLIEYLGNCRVMDKSIGLVPTMGALHMGHLELLNSSVRDNEITVCSIFVNPEQFNDPKDLENYPKDFENDRNLIESSGATVIFCPTQLEMYPSKPIIHFDFGNMEKVLEGKFRKGHFNGVGLVVSKLFNIVNPDRAYFGQKDFQQLMIIEKIVHDLSFNIKIVRVRTARESDGLAFSSRNRKLTEMERASAPVLYQSLIEAKNTLLNGGNIADVKLNAVRMCNEKGAEMEYFEIVEGSNLQPVEYIDQEKEVVLCVAARFGTVRLIDNIPLFD